jgi:hypothetical protein
MGLRKHADDTNFVAVATAVPANDNLCGSGSGSFCLMVSLGVRFPGPKSLRMKTWIILLR